MNIMLKIYKLFIASYFLNQIRVVAAIKFWVDGYFSDFQSDPELKFVLRDFVASLDGFEQFEKTFKHLSQILQNSDVR